ncbi:MAG: hypothetical protein ABI045_00495 [Flavobacteriales bacterium]
MIQQIRNAVSKGGDTSNADSASVMYENNDRNATTMYRNYFVDNCMDHAVSYTLIDLFKGYGGKNPFRSIVNPCLFRYAASKTEESIAKVNSRDYKDGSKD